MAKFDRKIEKTVLKLLDVAAKKHGVPNVRHAANKWATAQREKVALGKAQRELEKKLDEVNRKLRA